MESDTIAAFLCDAGADFSGQRGQRGGTAQVDTSFSDRHGIRVRQFLIRKPENDGGVGAKTFKQ